MADATKPPTDPNETPETGEGLSPAFSGFDGMDVCMLGVMPDGRIVHANQMACDMLGYPKEELAGTRFQALVVGMTDDGWSEFWEHVARRGGSEHRYPLVIRQRNREETMVSCRALRVQASGSEGCTLFLTKPEAAPVAAIDIQAHRDQLVQILDAMSNPVISIDDQHRITFMNRAACALHGTTVAESIGKTVYDYVPRKYAELAWSKEQEALESGRPTTLAVDSFMQVKFGGPVTFLPFFDPRSATKRVLVVVDNAPDLPHLPARASKGDDLPNKETNLTDLRRYLDEGAVGIYLKDADNRIVWVNQSYADMLGFGSEDLIGKRVDDLVNDPALMAELRREDETVLSTGRPLFNLVKQPQRDRQKFIRIDKLPFVDKHRKVTGIIGLAVEIPATDAETVREKLTVVSRRLEDTEAALRVLLDQREKDASQNREKLGERVKSLVLPYLENLKQTKLGKSQHAYVELIEENLKGFYDANYAKLAGPEYKLSPTELKVAQLVRDGKTNKEIAKLMNLSKSTILTHRHHVRVKLGIRNKKVNLRSLLNS
jgi:PAS domain S-box-containing protein